MNFSSNPIAIKHKGLTVGVIELDLDFSHKDFVLELTDVREQVLFKGKIDEDTFLSVDSSAEVLVLTYLDPANIDGDPLIKKRINIIEEYNITDLDDGRFEYLANERTLYEGISKKVKEVMDKPTGSAKEVEHHTLMMNKATMDNEARNYVESKIRQIVTQYGELTDGQVEDFSSRIYAEFYGMGILQEIDDDPDVGEIMVNGYEFPTFRSDIYYVKHGVKIPYNKKFKNIEDLKNVYGRAISFSKKELNNLENAIVEATRANRDRVNIIIPDASESYVLNIRKFGNFVPDVDNMKKFGTIDDFLDNLLRPIVKGKANIGIGGEMGTGKTTLINYLLTYTEKIERKVVIASVNETDVDRVLKGHDVVVLNVEDTKGFSFERLVRASLRTTASRVIVPESRGSEFKQVYEANLKTKGNMFTAHALDDEAFLDMCVDMYAGDGSNADVSNLKDKIAKSLDVVIIMRKVGNDIRVKSLSEVILDKNRGFKEMKVLYYWHQDPEDPTKGEYRRTEHRVSDALKARLNESGVPMSQLSDI